MLPRKAPKNASVAAAVEGRDHISNLPDGVLQHMLSFLPAQDVVGTCLLAKHWRYLWKSMTVLRFECGRWGGMEEPKSMTKQIEEFVGQLLTLRIHEGTPLHTCEFHIYDNEEFDFDMSRIILWTRISLQCKVRVLQFMCWETLGDYPSIGPNDGHPFFISQYLKKVKLETLNLEDNKSLDFSLCPNLKDLEIISCCLHDSLLIESQSQKRLTIGICSLGDDCRMPICAPNLVSLWLEVDDGRTPSLQRMPSLRTAYVKTHSYGDRDSTKSDDDDYRNQSILLQGLSEVQNLVLMSRDTEMFVFRRDLKFCSSFNNLKSLLLNEYWCEPADFSALACLLKLCPVLEKLTLQLYSLVYNF